MKKDLDATTKLRTALNAPRNRIEKIPIPRHNSRPRESGAFQSVDKIEKERHHRSIRRGTVIEGVAVEAKVLDSCVPVSGHQAPLLLRLIAR